VCLGPAHQGEEVEHPPSIFQCSSKVSVFVDLFFSDPLISFREGAEAVPSQGVELACRRLGIFLCAA
jgi:hypothetical protein